jgi:AraC-like DNA-binding protein
MYEGVSIFKFITARRIEVAKSLLAADYLPISAIAERAGFFDHNYSSRAFKRYVRMSPSNYRKICSQ